MLKVADADALQLDPVVEVVTPFEDTHYGTREMTVRDPDGRLWSLQAPATTPTQPATAVADEHAEAPDGTAVRVALWRAMHVEIDPPPHVLEDVVGLQLAAPDDDWRDRPDMHPRRHQRVPRRHRGPGPLHRGSGRRTGRRGVDQYVILGAGLDTLAQRRPELGARPPDLRGRPARHPGLEAPPPGSRLGFGVPDWLRLVPVDFEAGETGGTGWPPPASTLAVLRSSSSTGVTMYLSKEATAATLRQLAALAPGSTLAMTFLLPAELSTRPIGPDSEASTRGARLRDAVRQLLLARRDACSGP